MTIAKVRSHIVTKRSDQPLWNPRSVWREKNIVVVEVITSDGLTGHGEAWCTGGTPRAVTSVIDEDYAPQLIGRDPTQIGSIWQSLFEASLFRGESGICAAARSGIDIALWDLLGKRAGLPISRMLGSVREEVPVYASGGLYGEAKTLDDLKEEVSSYRSAGFHGVKLKVGGAEIWEDAERVAAVRDAIGDDALLMVDAVYSYDLERAKRFVRLTADSDIHFLEAPLPPEDTAGLLRLQEATGIPITGNEVFHSVDQFKRIIESRAVSFVQLDAILSGGITGAMKIAALAEAFSIPCTIHSSSSVIAFAANLHVAAAIPKLESLEYHMVHQMLFEDSHTHLSVTPRSTVEVQDAAGLGVDVGLVAAR